MSSEKADRAEKAERDRAKTARKAQEKAEKTERDTAEKARKTQEKTDRTEKDRAEKARKVQEKAEKTEKDRVDSAQKSERAKIFHDFLSDTGPKGCCEPCNYYVKKSNGEPQRCKIDHKDSGPDKEICADCSDPRYRPKK